MRLVTENDGSALVTYPGGRQVRFGKNADGTFAPPRESKAVLVASSATGPRSLQVAAGTKYEFAAGTGKVSKIYNTLGKPLALTYRPVRTLESASSQDGAGRKLSFTWTAEKEACRVGEHPPGHRRPVDVDL